MDSNNARFMATYNFFDNETLLYGDDYDGYILSPWKHYWPKRTWPNKRLRSYRGETLRFWRNKGGIGIDSSEDGYCFHIFACDRKWWDFIKHVSFQHPENWGENQKLKLISSDFHLTRLNVKFRDEKGISPNIGVQLNCIYVEFSTEVLGPTEEWVYIQKDHPLATGEVKKENIKRLEHNMVYYKCQEDFDWFLLPREYYALIMSESRWKDIWLQQ